jgi:UDP-GlcNAc:undecaprenyl-phosphate/decaprenyl-phosphate GlcNAc-1-phosphate transferase
MIRLLQALLFGAGIIWASTLSGGHLDQMQVPGFLLALAVSWWLTPEIRARAMRLGLVDKPGEERRIHKVAVPRLGGVALYISIIVALVICMAIGGRWPKEGGLAGIAAGGTLIFVLGLLDDLESIPAKIKLLVQILAACAAYSLGVRIHKLFYVPVSLDFLSWLPFIHPLQTGYTQIDLGPFAIVVTVLFLVGIANAVNLVDGMDGLAAGVSAIAAVAIWAVAMSVSGTHPNPAPYPALFAAVLAGALLGFLRWNFNPARIFLGDSGAYLSGFILACLAVTGVMKWSTALLTIGVVGLILFFPMLDTAMAIVRRLAKKQSPFTPDAEHIHHRLLRAEWTKGSQKKVAYTIYTGCGLLGLLATWLVGPDAAKTYLTIMGSVVVMAFLFSEVLNRHRQRQGHLPPDEPQ